MVPRLEPAGNLRSHCVSNLDEWSALLHGQDGAPRRPLLTHLNADTTWLIQLPYPKSVSPPPGRTHFNILLDPWLQGPQSDVAWWFSTQWHVVPPAVGTIAELDDCLRELEGRQEKKLDTKSMIDVVAISHEFTDHCHRATLEELPQSTLVLATEAAAKLIRSWDYFDKLVTTPTFEWKTGWSGITTGCLPDWVAIGRIITPGNARHFHSALLIAFKHLTEISYPGPIPSAEAIVYTPHGIDGETLDPLSRCGINTLALLHGWHSVRIPMVQQLNRGALMGIQAVECSQAKYWIPTHDEAKRSRGLVAPFLRRTKYSVEEAVENERKKPHDMEDGLMESTFVDLGSGDGLVLD